MCTPNKVDGAVSALRRRLQRSDRHRQAGALCALALLALALMSAAPAGAQVIRACYDQSTGALRIARAGHCGSAEAAVSWGAAGPAGKAGEPGRKGPRGREGKFGANGPTGATGAPGPSVAGVAGPAGANGGSGATGASGASGVTGASGPAGPGGPSGPSGATGATGFGAVGVTGATGPAGPAGPTGNTGATGTPLPPTLATGHSETGVWSAASPEVADEAASHLTVGPISFPIPLKTALSEDNVLFVSASETAKAPSARSSPLNEDCLGTLEAPTAKSGFLCVYTGVESLTSKANFHGIIKSTSAGGANKFGAEVVFEVTELKEGEPQDINARGTWAVTG